MGCLDVVFAPMQPLLAYPWMAFFPALCFLIVYVHARPSARKAGASAAVALVLLAAVGWTIYGFYEFHMQSWSRTVHAPIRIDLLFIAPCIYAGTALGIWACVVAERAAGTWRVGGTERSSHGGGEPGA